MSELSQRNVREVPFFRPSITEAEIAEVTDCLRSGWLTSGPRVKAFEKNFAAQVGAQHAVAVSSCTAALHLAVEALHLQAGQGVLVPTMTFAATAEIVLYFGAIPILVDCDPDTLNMDFQDAEAKLRSHGKQMDIVGMIPVHVGGQMLDLDRTDALAAEHGLWVVEDAAHAFPAAFRTNAAQPWRRCGENTARVTCYSFYANKTITTGEGGMAVTADEALAARMRQMSLHGLSHDAWKRYQGSSQWDYQIVAPGYKYNLTDVAAAIGLHQLERAESMRSEREQIAAFYSEAFAGVLQLELPVQNENRLHAWHLYPIRLRLDRLKIDRNEFIDQLRSRGVNISVHWRPLHLHTYYADALGWQPQDCPAASGVWQRLISLPLFPGMTQGERLQVATVVRELCQKFSRDESTSELDT